jgi:hypothetical protein
MAAHLNGRTHLLLTLFISLQATDHSLGTTLTTGLLGLFATWLERAAGCLAPLGCDLALSQPIRTKT